MANPLSPIQANGLSVPGYRQDPRQYGLPIVNQYGQYQVGGPLSLQTKEGQLDAMLEATPVGDARAMKRAKVAARPVIKDNLMGGATAEVADPYAVAFETATAMPALGDAATLAKMGAASLPGILALMARRNQALGAKAMAPQARHMQGIIGSTGAKTANLDLLAKAEQMKAAGHSADDIYSSTHWWLDHPDGRPRFEIDDSGSYFEGFTESPSRVGDALPHKDLYNAYPTTPAKYPVWEKKGLGDISIYDGSNPYSSFTDGGFKGQYDESADRIGLGNVYSRDEAQSTTLHELQHAIQGRENMARGGSPSELGYRLPENLAQQADENRKFVLNWEKENLVPLIQKKKAAGELTDLDVMDLAGNQEKKEILIFENFSESEYLEYLEASNKSKPINYVGKQGVLTPSEQYHALAGETEARLVQDRMNMPMDERLANPFYKNFDVPLDEQIVRMEGGTAQSLPLDEASRMAGEYDRLQRLRSNAFSKTTTDMPTYDNMIKNPEYFRKEKGIYPSMTEITPQHYLDRAAAGGRGNQGPEINLEIVKEYADKIRNGEQFPALVLDYSNGKLTQEGRHRALAAIEAGIDRVPVLEVR